MTMKPDDRFNTVAKGQERSSRELDLESLTWRRRVQRSKNLQESFLHACRGVELAFAAERNLKIHLICATAAILSAFVLSFDAVSWILLFLAIGLVMMAEFMNTAVERVVDMVSGGQFHILAKEAKDIAAAGVLISSVVALVIGVVLFAPKLMSLFSH